MNMKQIYDTTNKSPSEIKKLVGVDKVVHRPKFGAIQVEFRDEPLDERKEIKYSDVQQMYNSL